MSDGGESLICPITQELFRDPVIAEDGRLYEREAITRWITEHGTSPFTRQTLNVFYLQPDDEVRRRADQRRRLSVSYNREFDQVQLPPIRLSTTINVETQHQDTNMLSVRNRCSKIIKNLCCTIGQRKCSYVIVCSFILFCILPVVLFLTISRASSQQPESTTTTTTTSFNLCYTRTISLGRNSCMASFIGITIIDSRTCEIFPYRRMEYNFTALSSRTTIGFAFQQTYGYWDIDNIILWDERILQNRFRNGDFESGSLLPYYRQCRSAGTISTDSPFNSRYHYTDSTRSRFGFLMQNVSIIAGLRYSLSFDLQNRGGSNSTFMVLVGA